VLQYYVYSSFYKSLALASELVYVIMHRQIVSVFRVFDVLYAVHGSSGIAYLPVFCFISVQIDVSTCVCI
jgi:hypothetical protein